MDDLASVTPHLYTAGGTAGFIGVLLKFLGGRQVKQLDDTIAAINSTLKVLTESLTVQSTSIAVMNEKLSTLMADRAASVKLAERVGLLESSLAALHERLDNGSKRRGR